jgi:carotenoid cleavage dioxygenase-like enzyme
MNIENGKEQYMENNQDNPFLQGDYAPVNDELHVTNLEVIGKIPDDLFGIYMRNGPNPQFQPITYTYPFDGDGMVHAVYIDNGQASYKNRYIETFELLAERRAGKALYGGFKCPVPPDPNFVGENADPFKNGAFIHIIQHANQYLALFEPGTPYIVNEQLDTIGTWTPQGAKGKFEVGAHPRLCPKTGDIWMMKYDFQPPFLSVYRIDKFGVLQQSFDIEKSYSTMMHDFALTENYLIFFDCPLVFDVNNLTSGQDLIRWRPELGVRIGVMSRETGRVQWFQTESFFVFHFANAYEQGQEIIVDFVRHAELNLSKLETLKTGRKTSPPTLYRSKIHLLSQTVQHEQLDDRSVEFPRIKEDINSLRHRFIYTPATLGNTDHLSPLIKNALVKYDVEKCTSDIHDFGSAYEIDEAVFVPKATGTSEDDGYLMLFVYNKNDNNSELVILDAHSMKDKPLARIKMPRRVPHGLHGSWMS